MADFISQKVWLLIYISKVFMFPHVHLKLEYKLDIVPKNFLYTVATDLFKC